MRGGAMRSILIIGILTLVGITGLWFLFGDSTEVFELLYSSPTTIRIEGDTIDLDIVRYGEKKQISFRICNTGEVPLLIRDVGLLAAVLKSMGKASGTTRRRNVDFRHF